VAEQVRVHAFADATSKSAAPDHRLHTSDRIPLMSVALEQPAAPAVLQMGPQLLSKRRRRRTVQRLERSEVERLVNSAYQDRSQEGLLIKTLFLTGARVSEFVHITVEDLFLDDDSPQIHITHTKGGADRYVPILPAGSLYMQSMPNLLDDVLRLIVGEVMLTPQQQGLSNDGCQPGRGLRFRCLTVQFRLFSARHTRRVASLASSIAQYPSSAQL
jgi:integrase